MADNRATEHKQPQPQKLFKHIYHVEKDLDLGKPELMLPKKTLNLQSKQNRIS